MKYMLPFQFYKFTTLPVALVTMMCCSHLLADNLLILKSNGQQVTGELDSRTDEQELRIQKKTPRIILKSSFDWHDVKSLAYQGRKITRAELLQRIKQASVKELRQQEILQFWFPAGGMQPDNLQLRETNNSQPTGHSNRVAAVHVDAYAANWDSDAETDGLILHLTPVDQQGRIVPVNGQVDFKLIGERYNRGVRRSKSDDFTFPELGHWNKQIRKQDFGPDGVTVKLEFRKFHPEVDINLSSVALLTGSLGVSGQGKFHASVADVVIRSTSRMRDELQLRSRRRSRFHQRENVRGRLH